MGFALPVVDHAFKWTDPALCDPLPQHFSQSERRTRKIIGQYHIYNAGRNPEKVVERTVFLRDRNAVIGTVKNLAHDQLVKSAPVPDRGGQALKISLFVDHKDSVPAAFVVRTDYVDIGKNMDLFLSIVRRRTV